MSGAELKKRLIERIQKIDDVNLLGEAFRLLQPKSDDIDVYRLSEEQRAAVNEAREQYARGEFLTDDEANKNIDEWLNE